MNREELSALVRAYIEYFDSVTVSPDGNVTPTRDNSSTSWAVDKMVDITHDNPDLLWDVVLEFLKHDPSPQAVAVIAAGPVEDCLAYRGEEVIERVEHLAATNEKFRHMLGGVWKNAMSEAVWKRVQACRGEVW